MYKRKNWGSFKKNIFCTRLEYLYRNNDVIILKIGWKNSTNNSPCQNI